MTHGYVNDAKLDLASRPPRTFGIPCSLLEALLPSRRDSGAD
jgi:hypothetical protein